MDAANHDVSEVITRFDPVRLIVRNKSGDKNLCDNNCRGAYYARLAAYYVWS